MANNVTPAEHKINSFLTNGFLSGNELLEHMGKQNNENSITTSYDSKLRDQVPLNCVSKIDGIKISLFHPAKGGLVVMVEEKVGQKGILDEALERNSEAIKEKKKEFSIMPSYAESAARNFILSKDEKFLKEITNKVHKTALFILKDLTLEPGENKATDGCKETGRTKILSDKISYIILPVSYKDKFINIQSNKFEFIDSVQSNFIFCYKDEKDTPQQIKIDQGIKVPNYAAALEKLSLSRKLETDPIYTHMTRLP